MLLASILLLLVLALSAGVSATVSHEDDKVLHPFRAWEEKAWPIYGEGYVMSLDDSVRRLTELVQYEHQVNRHRIVVSDHQIKKRFNGRRMMSFYSSRWKDVARVLSLARKSKTLTQNLIELMNNDLNGCTIDEIKMLSRLNSTFQTKPGLSRALTNTYERQIINCQDRVYESISNPFKLIGFDDVERVYELADLCKFKIYAEYPLEKFALDLAKFLLDLEHPSIMSLYTSGDIESAFHTIRDAYLGNIFDPCSKVCSLSKSITNDAQLVSYYFQDSNETKSLQLQNLLETTKIACHISEFNVPLTVSYITTHYRRVFEYGK